MKSQPIPKTGAEAARTTAAAADSRQPPPQAEWMRVKEACAFSCLSKPKLYELMNQGHIKSVALRERGQSKGTRLVSIGSLRAFLESRASGGNGQA
ncbi:helix-turn-helix domain-containing protein [Prosthecobacter sp. SYSU 5D2]|uniref:helix-turn-helix domain-containing protein n=1 Tax=Prosthecobacter sp. SYSU 5D2 TaxID=3134134 RepID=UPI0031FE8DA3